MASIVIVGSKQVTVTTEGNAQAITRKDVPDMDLKTWLDMHDIKSVRGKVVLYKRVSSDLKTQGGTKNETLWAIGSALQHPDWAPAKTECEGGKYHACDTPAHCDAFRADNGDRYVAIEVKTKDLYAWATPTYIHKMAFRQGKVLYEVDRKGNKI